MPDLETASTQDLVLLPGGLYHALLRKEARKRAEESLLTPPNQSPGTPEPASPPSGQQNDQHHDTPLGCPRTCLRGSSWCRAQAQGRLTIDQPELSTHLGNRKSRQLGSTTALHASLPLRLRIAMAMTSAATSCLLHRLRASTSRHLQWSIKFTRMTRGLPSGLRLSLSLSYPPSLVKFVIKVQCHV